jgi:hypothetical protein
MDGWVGAGGGFTNNSCIDSLYYTNSQGKVNTTNAHRSRKKAFEQVVTTDEEKLVSRLLHVYEERA